jgi:DNA end-binding protein Ku
VAPRANWKGYLRLRVFRGHPELKLPKEMLDLAAHIVDTKSGHFDPSQFEDR